MSLRPDFSLPVPIKPVIDEMTRRADAICHCKENRRPFFHDSDLFYVAGCDGCGVRVSESKELFQERLI